MKLKNRKHFFRGPWSADATIEARYRWNTRIIINMGAHAMLRRTTTSGRTELALKSPRTKARKPQAEATLQELRKAYNFSRTGKGGRHAQLGNKLVSTPGFPAPAGCNTGFEFPRMITGGKLPSSSGFSEIGWRASSGQPVPAVPRARDEQPSYQLRRGSLSK